MLPQNSDKHNHLQSETQSSQVNIGTLSAFNLDAFVAHLKSRGLLSSPGENARVLVVEDERDVARSIMFALMQKGIECAHAGDGPDALMKIENFKPHVVLLDLTLPGLDGLDVCLRVKNEEATAGTRIIVVSARSSEHDVFFSSQVGADDHIAKPFDLRHLVDKVVEQLQEN